MSEKKKYVIIKANEIENVYLKDYEHGFESWTDEREDAIVFTDKEKVKNVALSLQTLYVGVCELVKQTVVVEELQPLTLEDLQL